MSLRHIGESGGGVGITSLLMKETMVVVMVVVPYHGVWVPLRC